MLEGRIIFQVHIKIKKIINHWTCVEGTRILYNPVWDGKCREHGKPKNKYSPRGIHVRGLDKKTHQLTIGEVIWQQKVRWLECFVCSPAD